MSKPEFKAFIKEGVKSNARLYAELENEDAVKGYTGNDTKELQRLKNAKWYALISYLQRDKWENISVQKFEQCIYKKDFEPPLTQDFPEKPA